MALPGFRMDQGLRTALSRTPAGGKGLAVCCRYERTDTGERSLNKESTAEEGWVCPACGSTDTRVFLRLADMPAQDGVLYSTQEQALAAPLGEIALSFCASCQYVGNSRFDPAIINFTEYSYSKHDSPQYRDHVAQLVKRLVEDHGIRGKRVVDVGCGEGYFLRQLCAAGANAGVGIDPSLPDAAGARDGPQSPEFIRGLYDEEAAGEAYDLVCCRHVLDEVSDPLALLQLMADTRRQSGRDLVYIELPNAWLTFERHLFWNLGYAKRSWFSQPALAGMLARCGLEVLWQEPQFGGEYLGVLARRARNADSTSAPASSETVLSELAGFARAYEGEMERWRLKMEEYRQAGSRFAVWGAGMRGINFLHRFGEPAVFPRIVDISADRQGKFLPGSGYRVEAPEALVEVRPESILVTNPNYLAEIQAQVREMGLDADIEAL